MKYKEYDFLDHIVDIKAREYGMRYKFCIRRRAFVRMEEYFRTIAGTERWCRENINDEVMVANMEMQFGEDIKTKTSKYWLAISYQSQHYVYFARDEDHVIFKMMFVL